MEEALIVDLDKKKFVRKVKLQRDKQVYGDRGWKNGWSKELGKRRRNGWSKELRKGWRKGVKCQVGHVH